MREINGLKRIIDELASTGFTTYDAIIEKCYGKKVPENLRKKLNATIRKLISKIPGHVIEKQKDEKDGRTITFRYTKGNLNYFTREAQHAFLEELAQKEGANAKKIFLTNGLQVLMDGQTSDEPLYEMETNLRLTNYRMVKELSKHLDKNVVEFQYAKEFDFEHPTTIIMSPAYMKEWNSRWNIVGFLHNGTETYPVHVPIDRIIPNTVRIIKNIPFERAPKGFYQNRYDQIVGMTYNEDKPREIIAIKTLDYKTHQYMLSKPIHQSQEEKLKYNEKKGEGMFEITVIPNFELMSRLLSYGAGVFVEGSGWFQKWFRSTILKMASYYIKEH